MSIALLALPTIAQDLYMVLDACPLFLQTSNPVSDFNRWAWPADAKYEPTDPKAPCTFVVAT